MKVKEKYLLVALVIAGIIVGYTGYILYAPSETTPTPTPSPKPTPVPKLDRNMGGVVSGLRNGDQAVVEVSRVEYNPSSGEWEKVESREIESGNGWWHIHYLAPGRHDVSCDASGYVSFPVSYEAIEVPSDEAPWSRLVFDFTLYPPEEAPEPPYTAMKPDRSLGGFISGLQEDDRVTITVFSDERVYETTRENGWWRINDLDPGNYTVKAEATGYTSHPESYDVSMPPLMKWSWTRMDLNFTLSPHSARMQEM